MCYCKISRIPSMQIWKPYHNILLVLGGSWRECYHIVQHTQHYKHPSHVTCQPLTMWKRFLEALPPYKRSPATCSRSEAEQRANRNPSWSLSHVFINLFTYLHTYVHTHLSLLEEQIIGLGSEVLIHLRSSDNTKISRVA